MTNNQLKLKQWDVKDDECRDFMRKNVEDAFCNEEATLKARVLQNQIISDLIRQEAYKAKINEIENLISNNREIVDIHVVSDAIVLVEQHLKVESKNYFTPIINKKVISHLYDSFDKALIGALSYKYNCEGFAYQAITAMFGIQDND